MVKRWRYLQILIPTLFKPNVGDKTTKAAHAVVAIVRWKFQSFIAWPSVMALHRPNAESYATLSSVFFFCSTGLQSSNFILMLSSIRQVDKRDKRYRKGQFIKSVLLAHRGRGKKKERRICVELLSCSGKIERRKARRWISQKLKQKIGVENLKSLCGRALNTYATLLIKCLQFDKSFAT